MERILLLLLLLCATCIVVGCTPPPGTEFSGVQRLRQRNSSRPVKRLRLAESDDTSSSSRGGTNAIIKRAKSCIGTPYRYGGVDKGGFDCSGLVLYSYKPVGVSLPRSARSQYQAGKRITLKQAKPGDLLFFKTNRRSISHVGIYLGNKSFIHAPSTGKRVKIDKLSNPYWRKVFAGSVTYLR